MKHRQQDRETAWGEHLVEITDVSDQGAGIGRDPYGRVLFVDGALPGDTVLCRVTRSKRNYAFAQPVEFVVSSPDRVEPRCRYFGDCGGCSLQHLSYPAQLRYKQKMVFDVLERIGGIDRATLERAFDGIYASAPTRYRNKGRFFATGRADIPYGMMARSSRRIVPIEDCLLMPESFRDRLRGPAAEPGTEIVLRDYDERATFAGIEVTVRGDAFLQVNTAVASAMLLRAVERSAVGRGDLVVELYSGVGVLTLLYARRTGAALGVEINPAAVESAVENAATLGLHEQARFVCADVGRYIVSDAWKELDPAPRLVVIDPPRAGCDPRVLAALDVPEILYISCEPGTLSRDLRILFERGYRLRSFSIHDMFAQTMHVETVCLMSRVEK